MPYNHVLIDDLHIFVLFIMSLMTLFVGSMVILMAVSIPVSMVISILVFVTILVDPSRYQALHHKTPDTTSQSPSPPHPQYSTNTSYSQFN